jgi:hypothetical protein
VVEGLVTFARSMAKTYLRFTVIRYAATSRRHLISTSPGLDSPFACFGFLIF